MDHQASFGEKVRYKIDEIFSQGTGALIAALAVFSLVVISLAAVILSITGIAMEGEGPMNFIEAFWVSMMRTFDAGTMGGDTGWGFRIIMLFVTIGGIFIISTLIGVLTSGVEGKLEELRKGRSRVLEKNHTIILGWTEEIFTLISELVTANENLPSSCIVIMANKDKVEMEDEIREKVENTGRTRVVCRTGSPVEISDLNIVSLDTARSIIVLSPDSDEPDAEVIKTVLAILNRPGRRENPYHIVAQVRDPRNIQVAKIVGKDEVEWLEVGTIISRITTQTCRQSGLSVVYTELLDFGGDEIYIHEEPALTGKTYADALLSYEKNAVMGIHPAGGTPSLNPPMDTILKQGDRLVLLAEDDDKIFYDQTVAGKVQKELMVDGKENGQNPERTLLLGWNWRGPGIISELENYVVSGSETTVISNQDEIKEQIEKANPDLKKQKINIRKGDPTDRRLLDSLGLEKFDHIIILCADDVPVQQADSHTLITLLHMRDIAQTGGHRFSIVSEMLDIRNRNLADVTRADDFIVSDKLISLLMAQVSENKYLNAVFTDLFDPEGSELYIKPAGLYVRTGVPVNFATVTASASRRGETVIGYRRMADAQDAGKGYGIIINPAKTREVTFAEDDKVIVLSEG